MYIEKNKNIPMIVFVVFALVVMLTTIAISGAWFSDSANTGAGDSVTFGTVSVSSTAPVSPYSSNVMFTQAELLPNTTDKTITRTLTIQNTGTVSIYTKFSLSLAFTDSTALNNMLVLSNVTSSGAVWQLQNGYYVYAQNTTTAKELAAGSGSNTLSITLTFTLSSNFGNAYANKTLRASFDVRAVQAAHNSATLSQTNWA